MDLLIREHLHKSGVVMDIFLGMNAGISDIAIESGDILGDESLYTAVLISLFTDKRADNVDELPVEYKVGTDLPDLRGYFGDALEGESMGSKLWLLKREKQISRVLVLAKQYAEESLEWLINGNYCRKITVDVENPTRGILELKISLDLHEEQRLFVGSNKNLKWNYRYSFMAF